MILVKTLLIILILIVNINLFAETNPWKLPIHHRMINRKQVQHIVLESKNDHIRVTLLICDRYPYNYKSKSYPLYIKTYSEKEAIEISEKISNYLETGWNIYIILSGSEIKRYILDEKII